MLRQERDEDFMTMMLMALDGFQTGIWTAMPAIINSFNPVAMTCEAQPSLLMKRRTRSGAIVDVQIPLLLDVPVVFPSGGGFTLTFPIAQGDEALIVFASRCIDSWWAYGGIENTQAEFRLHDLSDGFALVGPRSQPRVLPNISTSSVQLRSDAGTTFVDIVEGTITLHAPTKVLIDSPITECTGHLIVDGLLTYHEGIAGEAGSNGNSISGDLTITSGDVTADGISVKTHIHSDPQGGDTGPPI